MMASKVLWASYYWPTIQENCIDFVKRWKSCQKHCNLIHMTAIELQVIVHLGRSPSG